MDRIYLSDMKTGDIFTFIGRNNNNDGSYQGEILELLAVDHPRFVFNIISRPNVYHHPISLDINDGWKIHKPNQEYIKAMVDVPTWEHISERQIASEQDTEPEQEVSTDSLTASNATLEAVAPPADIQADELDRDERENAQRRADAIMSNVRGEMRTYTGAEDLARKCAAI